MKVIPAKIDWETAHQPGFVRLSIDGEQHVMSTREAQELAKAIEDSAKHSQEHAPLN